VKFWVVTAYNKQAMREESVYVHASHCRDRLMEILAEAQVNPGRVKEAPIRTPVRRLDDVRAARHLDVRYQPRDASADL